MPLSRACYVCRRYGYIVFFAIACPIVSLLAAVNNLVEIRSDAIKLVRVLQRPPVKHADGMGAWASILDVRDVM